MWFLEACSRKNLSFEPGRGAKKVADPCHSVLLIMQLLNPYPILLIAMSRTIKVRRKRNEVYS